MKLECLPEDRHEEAVEFLASAFATSRDAPFLSRELRHWKYYRPHPFWRDTRCYVYRDAVGLTAHGGFCPVQYSAGDGVKTSFQLIDWASTDQRCPGAGFLLFRELWTQADSHLGIGGSDDAQQVMRRIPGLRKMDAMAVCAYPLRPWGQLVESPWSWKSPLKLARSWGWRIARKRPRLDSWKAVPAERLSEADADLLVPAGNGGYCPLRRVPDLVNYWLECPAARVRAWRLQYAGAGVGLVVLAFLRKQTRIVDLVVNTASAPLAEAFSVAIDLAAQDRDACELVGASSAAPVVQAMVDAGMIPRGRSDIFFGDSHKRFPPNLPIEVNLTVGDGFYLQENQPGFLSF
jgi:hypothetical protein